MNGKQVGLYLRVSTGDQTIENQRQALTTACEARRWRIVEEFIDNGIRRIKAETARGNNARERKDDTRCPRTKISGSAWHSEEF